jgi:flavodoxin I
VEDFLAHDLLIIGTPTLGDAEVPGLESGAENESWAEFLPLLDGADMSGKIVAIFGLGDQVSYSTEFCDAMVELYDCVSACGATVVGAWPTEGYDFETSQAVLEDKFVGLALDQDNQSDLTEERLDTWLEQIRPALLEIYT